MGTHYLRGSIWWIGFVGSDGRWHYISAKTGDEQEALKRLSAIEEELKQGRRLAELGPLSVAEWGQRWQELRLKRVPKVWNAQSEWRQVQLHALPALIDERHAFGRMKLLEVRPRHALALVRALRTAELAPRTVANIWGTVHKLFEDAVLEEMIGGNPMRLPTQERPRRVDVDPTWRRKAIFTMAEVEQILGDPDLPEDRRVLYALGFLTGMREGEIADRRWYDYEPDLEPLGRLAVHSSYRRRNKVSKETKTGQAREVPVHPVLAAILAEWKLSGWELFFGRKPEPDDLIIPNRWELRHTDDSVMKGLKRDLKMMGLRHRRFHDLRRTFTTIARAGGAPKDVVRVIARTGIGDQEDQYTSFDWAVLCAAINCIKLGRRGRPISYKRSSERS